MGISPQRWIVCTRASSTWSSDLASRRDVCLAAMLYLQRAPGGITVAGLKQELVRARVPQAKQFNVADVLGRSGALVEVVEPGSRPNRWALTASGEAHVAGVAPAL